MIYNLIEITSSDLGPGIQEPRDLMEERVNRAIQEFEWVPIGGICVTSELVNGKTVLRYTQAMLDHKEEEAIRKKAIGNGLEKLTR